ncbi:MAG: gluconolactonase [Myxococcales bacterium]|nr:gluconolactonase [Myxococcales bacterium]
MNRYLSLLLVLPMGLYAACSSKGSDTTAANNGGTPGTEMPAPGTPDPNMPGAPGAPVATPSELQKNPIDGIAPAKLLIDTGVYTDGPIWSAKEGVLFFTTPLGVGGLYRVKPDGSAMKVRDGNAAAGEVPIGNTIDKAGNLLSIESKKIMRAGVAADAGAPTPVATGYDNGEAGVTPFDTLNDAVVSANGTIYATDPGYFETPISNRIYHITPAGKATVVEAFDDVPQPNGIALSPDGKFLYVGFTAPIKGTPPFIRKYNVNPDGTLAEHAKFTDLDNDSLPDGIEVDQAGNVFVATKAGVTVFKADATKIGVVPIPEQPTAMAFAGADLKTLYVTTGGTKIWELHVNVPGIVQ